MLILGFWLQEIEEFLRRRMGCFRGHLGVGDNKNWLTVSFGNGHRANAVGTQSFVEPQVPETPEFCGLLYCRKADFCRTAALQVVMLLKRSQQKILQAAVLPTLQLG